MRRSLRCWLGFHQWIEDSEGDWLCARCATLGPVCRNCGGRHDPTAIVVCTVYLMPGETRPGED
jgi:hypothetical protein